MPSFSIKNPESLLEKGESIPKSTLPSAIADALALAEEKKMMLACVKTNTSLLVVFNEHSTQDNFDTERSVRSTNFFLASEKDLLAAIDE